MGKTISNLMIMDLTCIDIIQRLTRHHCNEGGNPVMSKFSRIQAIRLAAAGMTKYIARLISISFAPKFL